MVEWGLAKPLVRVRFPPLASIQTGHISSAVSIFQQHLLILSFHNYNMLSFKKIVKHFSYETRKILGHKFLIVLAILIIYFLFSAWHFGLKDGFLVMILTWSFFVLATPIPDGGIVLDLPFRWLTGIKMIISEIFVWIIAISLNVFNLLFNPEIYSKTFILTLFKSIISSPFPYGIIIVLSCLGTFLSLYFGDELYDVISHSKRKKYQKHKNKFKLIMILSIIVFIVIVYDLLLRHLGIKII